MAAGSNDMQAISLRSMRVRGWAACLVAVLLLRFGAYYASRLLEYAPYASLWFPAAAVTFAAFAVFGWRALPSLVAANLLGAFAAAGRDGADVSSGRVLVEGLVYSAVHCLAYCALAAAVMRSAAANGRPSLPATINVFLLAGLGAATVAALGGSLALYLGGTLSAGEAGRAVLPWMIGDYTGLVSLGPLVLFALRGLAVRLRVPVSDVLFALDDLPQRSPAGARVYALMLPAILLVTVAGLWAISHDPTYAPLMLLVFVPIVLHFWLVHSQSAKQSLVSIALFDVALVVATRFLDLGGIAATLQCAMITLAAGSYFSMAVPMLYARSEELRTLLTHDSLTGAHTRRYFVELAERALRQSRTQAWPVSMLMIDLDHLKHVNDREGHAAGDRALSLVVRICRKSLREDDLLGRLGGDEFCAILAGRDAEDAAQCAQRMVEAVREAARVFPGELKPSLSIGVATAKADDDYESLWLRADTALYVAKRGGRNRIAQEEGG